MAIRTRASGPLSNSGFTEFWKKRAQAIHIGGILHHHNLRA